MEVVKEIVVVQVAGERKARVLEIRRENRRRAEYTEEMKTAEEMPDPYELCCSFLTELDDEEKEILRDVIHTVQEVK